MDGAGNLKTYQHVHWHIVKPVLLGIATFVTAINIVAFALPYQNDRWCSGNVHAPGRLPGICAGDPRPSVCPGSRPGAGYPRHGYWSWPGREGSWVAAGRTAWLWRDRAAGLTGTLDHQELSCARSCSPAAIVANVGVAILMFPVYWIVLSAFTPEQILFSSHFNFLPLHWSLANFRKG